MLCRLRLPCRALGLPCRLGSRLQGAVRGAHAWVRITQIVVVEGEAQVQQSAGASQAWSLGRPTKTATHTPALLTDEPPAATAAAAAAAPDTGGFLMSASSMRGPVVAAGVTSASAGAARGGVL